MAGARAAALPWTAALSGLLVAVAAVGVAVLAVGVVLRVSLSEQLTGVRRPRESSRISLVAQLVLVAAALAVLASKLTAGGPGDPDVTDLVLPVLLAVVAGVAATWPPPGGDLVDAAAYVPVARRLRGRRAISRRREGPW